MKAPVISARRREFAPSEPSAVLLASLGIPITAEAIQRCRVLAGGLHIAVLSVARMHGSGLGLPNPGLMPSKSEREQQLQNVSAAIQALERDGDSATGHVVITRNAAKSIARAAKRLQVRHVIIAAPGQGRLRRLVEGDPVEGVRRRLRDDPRINVS